jgi:hypothetical protein
LIPDRSPTTLDFGPHKEFIKRELPMLRIEKQSDGHTTALRLSGRIQSANIGNIRAQIDDDRVRIFMDLDEVTLVDVEVVRFLSECEDRGIVLVHCPPYVREWILRERAEGAQPQVPNGV